MGSIHKNNKPADAASPGKDAKARWEVIAIVGWAEAEVIHAKLEANDIPCVLQRESAGTAYVVTIGALGDVRVLVPEPLVEQALELLKVDDAEDDAEAAVENGEDSEETSSGQH